MKDTTEQAIDPRLEPVVTDSRDRIDPVKLGAIHDLKTTGQPLKAEQEAAWQAALEHGGPLLLQRAREKYHAGRWTWPGRSLSRPRPSL